MSPPSAPSPTLAPRRPRLAFALLAVVQATLIFTIALIMIPLPLIAAEFALDDARVLLLQVAYGLPFSALLLFGGRLVDRWGARRMLILGLVVFGAASATAPAAGSFPVLVAARFAQGLGGAIVAPAALAAVRAILPAPDAFTRAMAVWGGVSVLGAALGFVSSGMVSNWVSWRWMFAVPAVVALAGLTVAARLVPRAPSDQTRRIGLDLSGAALATAGVVLVSHGLISSHAPGAASGVLAPLAIGVVLLAGFLLRERLVPDPLLPPGFLLDRRRAVGLAGMLLAAAGSLLIEYLLLVHLQRDRGWSPFQTAVAFLPFAVVLVIANGFAASIVGRFGPVAALAAGLTTSAAAFALLTPLAPDTGYWAVLAPAQALLAAGLALAFAGAAVLSTDGVPSERMGLAGGVMNTAMELGPTVGFAALMAVAATAADPVAGAGRAFGAAAGACLLGAVVAGLAARTSGAPSPQR